ncbi:MAG: hypothetical protein V9H25_14010 [Candidatus Competibacter sp.]
MDAYPWRLENYFFPHQEVRANLSHDPNGNRLGSQFTPSFSLVAIEGRTNAVGVEASVSLDEDKSDNPPYFFTISAFGILTTDLETTDDMRTQAASFGINVLFGALRERLATLTSRAPWGTFVLGPVPFGLATPPQVESDSHP